eukprot:GHVN01014832.1.p1 GENE.GHVN01014832.1~~GHVN01014832.1.p1  ORF type:complete len:135 (-),score=36.17 GHVN01014832.1:35-439(-)
MKQSNKVDTTSNQPPKYELPSNQSWPTSPTSSSSSSSSSSSEADTSEDEEEIRYAKEEVQRGKMLLKDLPHIRYFNITKFPNPPLCKDLLSPNKSPSSNHYPSFGTEAEINCLNHELIKPNLIQKNEVAKWVKR